MKITICKVSNNLYKDMTYIVMILQDNFLGFYNATHLFYVIHTSDTKTCK